MSILQNIQQVQLQWEIYVAECYVALQMNVSVAYTGETQTTVEDYDAG